MKNTDVLIIGSGIAGLSFAIKIAKAKPDANIVILCKANPEENNTAHAQGGIAVVMDQLRDSFEQHIEDTIKAGKGLSDKAVVEMVVKQAPERLLELIDWGASFDYETNGKLSLALEGGHSQKRIVHRQDLTGKEIGTKLYQKAKSFQNVKFYNHYFVSDLLLEQEHNSTKCVGVIALDTAKNAFISIHSKIVFLATGGSGQIFENTTNPTVATGDGVAMAYRAGAEIRNMNYFQFHPTAFYEEKKHALFLISEAVRGFGAHVINHEGKRFLFSYDSRGEMATRDIVSQAIFSELKETGKKYAFLDCRHLNQNAFNEHFPTIVAHCKKLGIDLSTDLIPIVPAAHYQCGGIQVDKNGKTSIRNLYASGECTHTGLHGANRLASNSLLEALVFSHQASEAIILILENFPKNKTQIKIEVYRDKKRIHSAINIEELHKEFWSLMTFEAIFSEDEQTKRKLKSSLTKFETVIKNYENQMLFFPRFLELKNMLSIAGLILNHGLKKPAHIVKGIN